MTSDIKTASTVREYKNFRIRAAYWLLLEGDRRLIAAIILSGIIGIVGGLISGDYLAVGPDSAAANLFGGGLTSGIVALMTITLSINQLILSRVFGSPNELYDQLDGENRLRRNVERLARESTSPNDPAAFLSMIAATLVNRTETLKSMIDSSLWTPHEKSRMLLPTFGTTGTTSTNTSARTKV